MDDNHNAPRASSEAYYPAQPRYHQTLSSAAGVYFDEEGGGASPSREEFYAAVVHDATLALEASLMGSTLVGVWCVVEENCKM